MNTPPPATLTIRPQSAGATHSVCRLNPAKKGRAKWEPMFYVVCTAGRSPDEVTAELVKRQRLTQRDVTRSKVKVFAA